MKKKKATIVTREGSSFEVKQITNCMIHQNDIPKYIHITKLPLQWHIKPYSIVVLSCGLHCLLQPPQPTAPTHPTKTTSKPKITLAFSLATPRRGKIGNEHPSSNPKVLSGECLSELPVGRGDVPWGGGSSVTACNPKRQSLSDQLCVWLPVLPPVSAHAHPSRPRPLHTHSHNVACSGNIRDQHQIEITETVDGKTDSTALTTWHPVTKQKETMVLKK